MLSLHFLRLGTEGHTTESHQYMSLTAACHFLKVMVQMLVRIYQSFAKHITYEVHSWLWELDSYMNSVTELTKNLVLLLL